MTEEHRPAVAAVSVALVLSAIAITAVLAYAATPVVAPTGSVSIERGARAVTEWIELPNGGEAMWHWESNAFIVFAVEIRGQGYLDGGDTSEDFGCLYADHGFAVRLGWAHTAFPSTARPATVSYSIGGSEGVGSECLHAHYLSEVRRAPMFSGTFEGQSLPAVVLPFVVGNAGFLFFVRYATTRPPQEERDRRIIERERAVQEREAWVAEQVRRKGGG